MRAVILGCGYVGIRLGRQLAAAGHRVVGVRRSEDGVREIRDAGLDAVQADVTDAESLASVPDADWVIFAASSGGRGAAAARDVYVDGLRTAIDAFGARDDPPERFVYTSSTGVYGDHDGDWVDEETSLDPDSERARVLVEAERVALDATADRGIDGTVARFGGLYGPGRYRIERYIDGPVTDGYLNLVHGDDAAGAVTHLLDGDHARGDVVLVVDDEPISRWEFADWLADQCGVERPEKQTKAERIDGADLSETATRRILSDKRCSNDYLRSLGYEFTYPTVREGYQSAIEAFRADTE